VLVVTDIICLLFLKFFFGTLRSVEVSYLYDQFIKKLINIILIFYFLSMDITDKRCMALIIYPTILFLLHKLAHKRMEFMTTTRNRDLWTYFKMGLLFAILMTINILSIRLLYDRKTIYDTDDMSIHSILNLFTVLELCSMTIYLCFYIIKYFANLFEILTRYEFENKETAFKVIALLSSLISLGLEMIILILIVMRTKYFPFFIIGGILNSVFEIISNIKLLYVAIVQLKKLHNIMEVTKEEMEEEELDNTCIICLATVDKGGKMLECKHVFHLK